MECEDAMTYPDYVLPVLERNFQSFPFREKVRVLLLQIHYPLTMGSYFIKALQHREDVDLKIVGPYTGSFIPWLGGMNLPMKYALPPDIPLPFSPNVGEVNYEMVAAQLGDWKPDLILNIDAGIHWKYKPNTGYIVTVGTDPHVLNDSYDVPRSYSDKFFNMQKVYSKPEDIYLPYAYSKYDFFPQDIVNPDDAVDAVLIGMPYAQRVEWVNQLRARGVKVLFENGPVFDEAREMYNRGKIGLNWSSKDDLNCRAFELPALKLFPVTNWVTDMKEYPIGMFGHVFTTMDEAIEIVVWAKEHPEEAKREAEFAYNVVKPHTYDARVQTILEECGFA